jgi:RNA polymerase sigma-70 factor (ECF subfamily)
VSQANGRVDKAGPEGVVEQADDACLVALAQADPSAFAHLYERYVQSIYWFCYRRLGSVQAAEDATSAIFVKALTALPRFEVKGGTFRSWLFTIAHNVVLDCLRQASRRGDRSLETVAEIEDGAPSPEATAVAGDESSALRAALARLTEEQRQIVELRLAGLNGLEIAAALGTSHAAVRTAQRRALLRLRALLDIEIGTSPGAITPDERRTHG